jgi:ABC-type phosphate/phosphonate transport system substrate-binding protein
MRDGWRRVARASLSATVIWMVASATTALAEECKNRGQLDTLYCDEDNDLVADVPNDPKKLKDPSTLVFAYTPVEDPAVYQNVFKPFTDFLAQCTGKRVIYYPVQSNAAEIEAMRSGRLHVAGFSTGPTGFAVNLAGAVPFAAKGTEKGPHGYHLIFDRQKGQSLPETLRSQGQARRTHIAVVEFGSSGAAHAISARRPEAERGLQAADVRRT